MDFDFLLCNIAFGDGIPANQYAHSCFILEAFVIQTSHYDDLPCGISFIVSYTCIIPKERYQYYSRN